MLCDASKAQDISNRYTYTRLAPSYQKELSDLNIPVPNSVLSELEMEFFASMVNVLSDPGDVEQQRIDVISILSADFYTYIVNSTTALAGELEGCTEKATKAINILNKPSFRETIHRNLTLKVEILIQAWSLEKLALLNKNDASTVTELSELVENTVFNILEEWLKMNYLNLISDLRLSFFNKNKTYNLTFLSLVNDRYSNFSQYLGMALGEMAQPTIISMFGGSSPNSSEAKVKLKIQQRDMRWITFITDEDDGKQQRFRLSTESN